MSDTVILLGEYDLTQKISDEGTISVSLETAEGIISQLALNRTFRVRDNIGQVSPISANGALSLNSYRNADIDETGEDGQQKFSGLIKNYVHEVTGIGDNVILDVSEPMGTILQFPIEEGDGTTHAGFQVSGVHPVGSQTITVKTGTTDIPPGSLVSFGGNIVPRYQIQAASGSPTISITLDRGIETALSNNDALRVIVPAAKTIPEALKDAFVSVGLSDYLLSGFDALHEIDNLNSRYIQLLIPIEKNITFQAHVTKLFEMGNIFLYRDENGFIDIFRGLAWDGNSTYEKISGNEMLGDPISIRPDFSKLIIGYETLYITSNNNVAKAAGDAAQVYLDEYQGTKTWQPIGASNTTTSEYLYLYYNEATANYFGQLMLDFYSVPRTIISCGLKSYFSNQPNKQIDIKGGKKFLLSMNLGNGTSYIDEPVIVMSFVKDKMSEVFSEIRLMLNNFLQPGIYRPGPTLEPPTITNILRVIFDVHIEYTPSTSPDILQYVFQVANNPSFTDAVEHFATGIGKIADEKYYLKLKKILNTKYIRCKAVDENGNYSDWSDTESTEGAESYDIFRLYDGSEFILSNGNNFYIRT